MTRLAGLLHSLRRAGRTSRAGAITTPAPARPAACRLEPIRPPDHVWRFCSLALMRDLFGGRILFREWGRIGQAGTVRLTHYADRPSAERAFEKIVKTKIRRGYRPVAGEAGWP